VIAVINSFNVKEFKMNNSSFEIKATIQIAKSPAEIFEAIIDPVKMSNYFIAESSGRMEQGKELEWKFPEMDTKVPVRVGKIEKDKYVSYSWDNKDSEQLVEMTLSPAKNGVGTVVTVTEKTTKGEATIDWVKGNTEGWANFLACLKAFLEYGINLRKGAFDFMRK
jgi:uncharacterized protein YndB with AHSA1/START domain